MLVIPLVEASAAVAGGKAAALGALLRDGERVPAGFCVTTEAYRRGTVPEDEILDAYAKLGGGPVAVRSSATAEDLPGASFAGQYDTVLDVTGGPELIAAVATCWESLHNARAAAYAFGRGIDPATAGMAVIVQRMIDAELAGVLFTANPLTGCRTEMMVDSAAGPGASVVDGGSAVDHRRLDGSEAPDSRWAALREVGERLQRRFGSPQDIEWAFDREGVLWVLQSRPVTTLFPLPPRSADPRIYLEFGHVQGMLRPVTPMGMATLRKMISAMAAALGLRVEIVDIGGRLYGDLTDLARSRSARKRLVKLMAVDFGPRAQAVMEHVLADPRFAPGPQPARARRSGGAKTAGRALSGIVRALARPEAARLRVADAVERLRLGAAVPGDLASAADRLRFVEGDGPGDGADDLTWPIVAGMLAAALPGRLLEGVATTDEIHTVLGGMPHNVTIEMDLALWHLAQAAAGHRALLVGTAPADLAARYRRGDLPDIGLQTFLHAYGHRAVAEADLGMPRWSDDPTPLFAVIANYLRHTDPGQAPDVRFARAAATAEATLTELAARARKRRPVRGRIAVFLLRRARMLAGLRESGKFAGLYHLQAMRRQLLLAGADLAGAGLLAEPGDIMFLTLDEANDAVHRGADQHATVERAKAVYRTESLRRTVPVALFSDGTDVETVLTTAPGKDGVLNGVGAAPGRVTGPARVVLDPATAHIEPGEILVAATTDPGWTPLFLTAAALVTETGAIMAHGPTVAREYGIPAVISVPAATERLATGQIITVDGAAGTVTVDPIAL